MHICLSLSQVKYVVQNNDCKPGKIDLYKDMEKENFEELDIDDQLEDIV